MMIFRNDDGQPIGHCRICGEMARIDEYALFSGGTILIGHDPPRDHTAQLTEWPKGYEILGYIYPIELVHPKEGGEKIKIRIRPIWSYERLRRENPMMAWDLRACGLCGELMKRERFGDPWQHWEHCRVKKGYDHEARAGGPTKEEGQAYREKLHAILGSLDDEKLCKAVGMAPIGHFLKGI